MMRDGDGEEDEEGEEGNREWKVGQEVCLFVFDFLVFGGVRVRGRVVWDEGRRNGGKGTKS